LLADDQRAKRIVGGQAACIPDDVGIAGPQGEHVLDGEPGVHARQDSQFSARWEGKDGTIELGPVALVLREGARVLVRVCLDCHDNLRLKDLFRSAGGRSGRGTVDWTTRAGRLAAQRRAREAGP